MRPPWAGPGCAGSLPRPISRRLLVSKRAVHGSENLAVRTNGQILLSTITSPTTQMLDPSAASPQPVVLHTYPGATSTLGIAQPQTDLFAIVVGNYTGFAGVKGSFAIWTLDLRQGSARHSHKGRIDPRGGIPEWCLDRHRESRPGLSCRLRLGGHLSSGPYHWPIHRD